ncbi:hypothetical protein T11_13155 [Trichinella zimbabwensis]|uniref:Uncharacterized protein n=1 Tax=Trichinella zimbabwensis TaxID=268475 RepID=A0A0V1GGK6_9BILA|nr:hypothetical protein T11_13155 [Trichinella zimbabwensis]
MHLGLPRSCLGRAWVTVKSAKNDFSGNFTENAPRMTQVVPGSLRNVRKMTFQIILAEMLLGWPRSCLGHPEKCKKRLFSKF